MRTILSLSLAGILMVTAAGAEAQESSPKQEASSKQTAVARSKEGKKLFGAEDLLRIARVSAPRISPDGAHVAYLVSSVTAGKEGDAAEKGGTPGKFVSQLWVVPGAGPASAARQFTRGEKSVANAQWSPDGRILAFTKEGTEEKDAKSQVWFLYADGGEAWQVTKHKSGVAGYEFSPDGKTLLLIATVPDSAEQEKRKKDKDDAVVVDHDLKMEHLWSWNIATGEGKQITHGDFTVSDARWSPDGTHITFTSNPTPRADDGSLQTAWVLEVATGKQRQLVETKDATHTARWSYDGKWIAYLSTVGDGIYQQNLFVVSADGGESRKLMGGFELNAEEPIWALDGKTIYFSSVDRESEEVFAADVAAGTVRRLTDKPGVLHLAGISANGGTMVGTWADPKHPDEVFRSDLRFSAIEPITNHNAWLGDYALGETEAIRWKSTKDGMEIEGIVTKPVGYDGSHKVPFLLNPHGGPTGASLLSFSLAAQVMAANGYMVLQPNFRGSIGRGEKFARGNQNDWGNGDYKDDMSGVQAVVDRGWADPARLGAFGWSYGGYMTFWIDTQTDRFKAISPGAGLPDLYSMYSQSDIHRYMRQYFDEKAPWDNFQEYWDHSPMKYVENVKTPTMILHGQSDTRVPIPQSEEFYRALSERHIPVEYVVYPRENHGFVEPRHLVDRLQRYLVFFGKYLNNPPVTEPKEVVEHMQKDLP
ncbi:MAG TPA: S9 family peptidase [Candidatus Cybelea sp.]|nr:S9 family peptidase [Candidatus Cybelea sp.]